MFLNQSLTELPQEHKFNAIDIFKFICVIMICAVHISPINTEGYEQINFFIQNYVCRIAVPFYFVTAGFFLFRKIDISNIDKCRIKEYCFKLLRLLGLWFFLLSSDSKTHLWFFGALVLSVLIIYFMLKIKWSFKRITAVVIILYILGLLGGSYITSIEFIKENAFINFLFKAYYNIFVTTRNGLFFGTIFTWIGVLFAQQKIVLKRFVAFFGLVLSFVAMFFEVYFLKNQFMVKEYDMLISLLPVTFFLFYIVSHIEIKKELDYIKLRRVGLLVFFLHFFVNTYLGKVLNWIKGHEILNLVPFQLWLVIVACSIIGLIIERLSRTERFSFLRYLYS